MMYGYYLLNETGEALAVEYIDKKHIKIADSLYDLSMNCIFPY